MITIMLLALLAVLVTGFILIVFLRVFNKINTKQCDCPVDLNFKDKVIVMTGSNTGIGLYAACGLSFKEPKKIILGCRNVEGTEEVIKRLKKNYEFNPKCEVVIKELNLLSLNKVRNFCSDILIHENRLDILVLNAGAGAKCSMLTEDNLEQQFQSNHLSHFLMTQLLKDRMIETAQNYGTQSRIVVTSSLAHLLGRINLKNIVSHSLFSQHPFKTYSDTKLLNVLFTVEMARRLKKDGLDELLTINCFEPGTVYTNGIKYNEIWYLKWFLLFLCYVYNRTAQDAAQNIIHLAISPELKTVSGGYFSNLSLSNPSASSRNQKLAEECWSLSEEICEKQLNKWQQLTDRPPEEKGRSYQQLILRNRTLEKRMI